MSQFNHGYINTNSHQRESRRHINSNTAQNNNMNYVNQIQNQNMPFLVQRGSPGDDYEILNMDKEESNSPNIWQRNVLLNSNYNDRSANLNSMSTTFSPTPAYGQRRTSSPLSFYEEYENPSSHQNINRGGHGSQNLNGGGNIVFNPQERNNLSSNLNGNNSYANLAEEARRRLRRSALENSGGSESQQQAQIRQQQQIEEQFRRQQQSSSNDALKRINNIRNSSSGAQGSMNNSHSSNLNGRVSSGGSMSNNKSSHNNITAQTMNAMQQAQRDSMIREQQQAQMSRGSAASTSMNNNNRPSSSQSPENNNRKSHSSSKPNKIDPRNQIVLNPSDHVAATANSLNSLSRDREKGQVSIPLPTDVLTFTKEIATRPDASEVPNEPIVEYYIESLRCHLKPFTDPKTGQKYQPASYKIKILSVEVLPSSRTDSNLSNGTEGGSGSSGEEARERWSQAKQNLLNNRPCKNLGAAPYALDSDLKGVTGQSDVKKFFLRLKPSKYANSGKESFHHNNGSSMNRYYRKKMCGLLDFGLFCPEVGDNGNSLTMLRKGAGQGITTKNQALQALSNNNQSQMQGNELGGNQNGYGAGGVLSGQQLTALVSATAKNNTGKFERTLQKEGKLDLLPTMQAISTIFKGMVVSNPLETYQDASTFGNSRDPRSISEQANLTSPLHGIPKIKIPICCKKKNPCTDKEFHLRQMVVSLQAVLQLIFDFSGFAFDFMIDNTLQFCACSTTREKLGTNIASEADLAKLVQQHRALNKSNLGPNGEPRISFPMVMINLQRIPNRFSVLAHIIGHEYGHIMRGHLQQQCRCQFSPSSYQHRMLEYEADQYSALFIATLGINPLDIYSHLANDEVRLSQLKHFVNVFSMGGWEEGGYNMSRVQRGELPTADRLTALREQYGVPHGYSASVGGTLMGAIPRKKFKVFDKDKISSRENRLREAIGNEKGSPVKRLVRMLTRERVGESSDSGEY